MKKIIFCSLLWLPAVAFAQDIHYTIKGKMGHMGAPAKAYLEYFKNGDVIRDSAAIRDGNFTISGEVEGPVQSAQVIIDTLGDGMTLHTRGFGFHAILLFLEPGTISIVSPKGPDEAVLGGTPTNIEYERFNKRPKVMALDKEINADWDKWAASLYLKPMDTALTYKYGRMWSKPFSEKHAVEKEYLKTHPDSYVSLLFLQISMPGGFNADSTEPLFNKLTAKVRNTPKGHEIATKIDQARHLAVGAYAPDFTENDTTGKAVSLSSFRGKYVLLDFWASWCVPCRHETPNVRTVYNQYKNKNFTILSVSLDKGKPEWVEAIQQDTMAWTHVSALQYWQDPVAKKYNISSVPSNFLIDPSGKIIATNLMGEELGKKMAEVIPN